GLLGLRDRVEALGGRMQMTSPVGIGTSLYVTIPLDGETTAPDESGDSP
ncbi:MAG: hypothetical protein JWR37_3444, partial [Mycobacterium sp.]|nr:hypothetical protein [Mycobacterium sp.]